MLGNILSQFRIAFQQVMHSPVKKFVIRFLVLLTAWKVLYVFLLLPAGIPDNNLTKLLAAGTSGVINIVRNDSLKVHVGTFEFKSLNNTDHFSTNGEQSECLTDRRGKPLLGIANICNGLDFLSLYAILILCFPYSWKRKIFFIFAGWSLMIVFNIIRIVLLFFTGLNMNIRYFDFEHHYLFKILMYGLIIFLWNSYTSGKLKLYENK